MLHTAVTSKCYELLDKLLENISKHLKLVTAHSLDLGSFRVVYTKMEEDFLIGFAFIFVITWPKVNLCIYWSHRQKTFNLMETNCYPPCLGTIHRLLNKRASHINSNFEGPTHIVRDSHLKCETLFPILRWAKHKYQYGLH